LEQGVEVNGPDTEVWRNPSATRGKKDYGAALVSSKPEGGVRHARKNDLGDEKEGRW